METVTDESYGVVPVVKEDKEWKVLLIHQISYRGGNDRFWTFPKGHAEEEETATQTAKRELLEETGIEHVHLLERAVFSMQYSFRHDGKLIKKTVTYYLGLCQDTETTISNPDEIADIKWFTFKEATEKITHKNAQEILLQVGQYINQNLEKI